eukprot:7934289-Ditylum_brightwellii.AAC.1
MNVNKAFTPTTEIKAIYKEYNLQDAVYYLHEDLSPTTYQQGRNQIDFLFIIPSLLPGILATNILFLGDYHDPIHNSGWKLAATNPKC